MIALFGMISFGIFSYIFKKEKKTLEEFTQMIPQSPFKKNEQKLMNALNELKDEKYELLTIKTKDKQTLYAKYYHYHSDTTFILVHGYHSSPEMDYAYFIQKFIQKKYNVLCIHQRAHSPSTGNYVTFGCLEKDDLLQWVDLINQIHPCKYLFIHGTSMGSSTVAFAAKQLKNVHGIILDCGYTSVKAIIQKEMKKKKIARFPFYFLINFYCKLLGHFSMENQSCEQALKENTIPTLFIHGKKDQVVPFKMGISNYNANRSDKEMFVGEESNHATTFYLYTEELISTIEKFMKNCIKK